LLSVEPDEGTDVSHSLVGNEVRDIAVRRLCMEWPGSGCIVISRARYRMPKYAFAICSCMFLASASRLQLASPKTRGEYWGPSHQTSRACHDVTRRNGLAFETAWSETRDAKRLAHVEELCSRLR
jgi:hypothetical protein